MIARWTNSIDRSIIMKNEYPRGENDYHSMIDDGSNAQIFQVHWIHYSGGTFTIEQLKSNKMFCLQVVRALHHLKEALNIIHRGLLFIDFFIYLYIYNYKKMLI